jgi:hypothetical protein
MAGKKEEKVLDNVQEIIVEKEVEKQELQKTLDVKNNKDLKEKVADVEIFGDDVWHLLCKASSKEQGWMKSTKVMNVFGGCLVRVTTQNKDHVAESVVFVPHNQFDEQACSITAIV